MILAEGLSRILSPSHKTFGGLLDSRRSGIVELSMIHLVDVLRSILMLPEHINIPAAWFGADLANKSDIWHYKLQDEEIGELITAANKFCASGEELGKINPQNFVLDKFAVRLSELQEELKTGIGFKLISGLPVGQLTPELYSTVFCGLGSFLGKARSQNAAGHLLGHVRDTGASAKDPSVRIYQTSARQTFHTDRSDVVGLLCIREAKEGGDSLLASSVTAFNEVMKKSPSLAEELMRPVAYDRRGEIPTGQKPYMTIPVVNWYKGKLTCIYQREYIISAQRYKDAPKLTRSQIEAFDLFDEVLNDDKINLKMRLRPGDMQFVYNHSLFHDRTGFVDWPEPEKKRHLLRLWISLPGDRELPPTFSQAYGNLDVGDRGGVITNETVLHAPLDA